MRVLIIALSLLTLALGAPLAPPALAEAQCPLIGTDAVSAIVGSTVEIDELLITSSNERDECIFMGETTVALGRITGYFGATGLEPFQPDQLRQLSRLNTDAEMVFTPESGIGDMAAWAQMADLALREEYFSVLIVRRGADAFYFSVDDSVTPNAPEVTKTLGNAVLAMIP